MNKKRVGSQVTDIFASTTTSFTKTSNIPTMPEQKLPDKILNTKDQAHDKTIKSTVTFLNSQVVWLDRLSSNIRAHSMTIVDRGAIIRAFITALEKSDLDLTNATSEKQIQEIILTKLTK